jgi:hypothetical protein
VSKQETFLELVEKGAMHLSLLQQGSAGSEQNQ